MKLTENKIKQQNKIQEDDKVALMKEVYGDNLFYSPSEILLKKRTNKVEQRENNHMYITNSEDNFDKEHAYNDVCKRTIDDYQNDVQFQQLTGYFNNDTDENIPIEEMIDYNGTSLNREFLKYQDNKECELLIETTGAMGDYCNYIEYQDQMEEQYCGDIEYQNSKKLILNNQNNKKDETIDFIGAMGDYYEHDHGQVKIGTMKDCNGNRDFNIASKSIKQTDQYYDNKNKQLSSEIMNNFREEIQLTSIRRSDYQNDNKFLIMNERKYNHQDKREQNRYDNEKYNNVNTDMSSIYI